MWFHPRQTLDPEHAAHNLRISLYVTEEHAGSKNIEGRPD